MQRGKVPMRKSLEINNERETSDAETCGEEDTENKAPRIHREPKQSDKKLSLLVVQTGNEKRKRVELV